MTRQELTALRDALTVALALPDDLREQLARWLAPEPAPRPGNGLDPDPPPSASTPRPTHAAKPAKAPAGERKLLEAMKANPGLSANALARAAGMSRSTTGERLKRLAAQGAIEKFPDGWRIAGEGPRPIQPSP
jgi:hypothetical protein